MSTTRSRDQQLDLMIGQLKAEFGGQIDDATIEAVAGSAFNELVLSSKVEAFIPILAHRRARDRTRLLALNADAVPGFLEPGQVPSHRPGEIVDLVDGPFEVIDLRPTPHGIEYLGRWTHNA